MAGGAALQELGQALQGAAGPGGVVGDAAEAVEQLDAELPLYLGGVGLKGGGSPDGLGGVLAMWRPRRWSICYNHRPHC